MADSVPSRPSPHTPAELDAALALLQLLYSGTRQEVTEPFREVTATGSPSNSPAPRRERSRRPVRPLRPTSPASLSRPARPGSTVTPVVPARPARSTRSGRPVRPVRPVGGVRRADPDRSSDMVAIGQGYARIARDVYESMEWGKEPSVLTRTLLRAVFTRTVLATHSLSGKPSPAFPDLPAKQQLDTRLVADIVHTVCTNCGVHADGVRKTITTLCADERKRQKKLDASANKSTAEETPPSSHQRSHRVEL